MTTKKNILIRFNPGEVSRLYSVLVHQREKAVKELHMHKSQAKAMELRSIAENIEAIRFLIMCDDDWIMLN